MEAKTIIFGVLLAAMSAPLGLVGVAKIMSKKTQFGIVPMNQTMMKLGLVVATLYSLITTSAAQTKPSSMKLNAGIITSKLKETKQFYTKVLQMEIVFENDFYLLLQTAGGNDQISFLLPNHESQQPLFKPAFGGKGVYLTVDVDNVDAEYARIKKLAVPIAIELRNEPWGDRHFAIVDPNGVGVDIVTYHQPEQK